MTPQKLKWEYGHYDKMWKSSPGRYRIQMSRKGKKTTAWVYVEKSFWDSGIIVVGSGRSLAEAKMIAQGHYNREVATLTKKNDG